MIEIIGAGRQEPQWRDLPKNVRQIGESRETRKIYIEDYVVTYLRRLSRPNQAYARGAILFGKTYQTEEGPAIFIHGAIEAQNLELDMDETIFDDAIWDELMERGQRYFPGQEIMGWFLSRMGFSVDMNQKIINTHLKNFPGDHKVLYMIDSLEKEDAMYLCENQQMKRQKGYYIYYEKNSSMQEYMLASDENKKKETEEDVQKGEIRRDKKVVNGYRKMSQYSRQNKKQDIRIRAIRAACILLILVMGVYITGQLQERWGNHDWKEYVVETFSAAKSVFTGDEGEKVQEETMTADGQTAQQGVSDGNKKETDQIIGPESMDGTAKSTANTGDGTTADSETDSAEETFVQNKPLYYIVQKGDTLAAISRKMYSTDKYTQQIAWANSLSNANEIYEGQKILIPSIE